MTQIGPAHSDTEVHCAEVCSHFQEASRPIRDPHSHAADAGEGDHRDHCRRLPGVHTEEPP